MEHVYNMRIHTITDTTEDLCSCDISGSGSIAGVTKAIILSNLITYFDLDYSNPHDRAIIDIAIEESLKRKISG